MCKSCKMDPQEMAKFYQRQGAVDISDFDEEPRWRKPSGGWRSKGKACRKSKTGEKCDFSASVIHGTKVVPEYGLNDEGRYARIGWKTVPRVVRCCVRCKKYDWSSRWAY